MTPPFPYHAGELAVQAAAGLSPAAASSGRAITDRIACGAWRFIESQSIAVLGSWDGKRGAWPTLLIGPPGFMNTRDGTSLQFAMTSAAPDPNDPLWANLEATGLLGVLAIDLSTRRRLRVNGYVEPLLLSTSLLRGFELKVRQAYGNCPKYIQRRAIHLATSLEAGREVGRSKHLSDGQVDSILGADTFFVATVHPVQGTDVSHRGGTAGFVRVEAADRLRIPDYAGNAMFNTLGNIHATGIAGLLFIDFQSLRLLQLVGDAAIDWSSRGPDVKRSWIFDVREVRESTLPGGMDWTYLDASPFNP